VDNVGGASAVDMVWRGIRNGGNGGLMRRGEAIVSEFES
jgi:hypothetical protein